MQNELLVESMKFVKIFVDCHGFCDTDYIIPKKVICANCKHHLIGKKKRGFVLHQHILLYWIK